MPIERDLVQADQAHVLHSLHHPSAHQTPKVWVEGRGAFVTDSTGKTYLTGSVASGMLWSATGVKSWRRLPMTRCAS